jgi:uncharacterized protein
MMKQITRALGLGLLALLGAEPAAARPVTDCPGRNAPFSLASPLVDVLLSPAATAVVERSLPGELAKMPPLFTGTKAPTFGAILTLGDAARFIRGGESGPALEAQLAAIGAELGTLPVTKSDKAARCARYDNDVPQFKLAPGRPRVLLFEKINGFRDGPSVDAAHAMFVAMAARKGWSLAITEKAGAFNPRTLAKFDVVVWNNISGDVLTLGQRQAFQNYLKRGGGFVGMHGTAGDPAYFWDWYADSLIGARFAGHPNNPQFQNARISVDKSHPLAAGLPAEWTMNDEWYSFKTNPRAAGARVLLTLDERSYSPEGWPGQNLRMGADHPLAWSNCVGKGRMFYSAIGHRPETYDHPLHVAMIEAAMTWAATARKACPAKD